MSKTPILCEDKLRKAKRMNWVLGIMAPLLFVGGFLLRPMLFHHTMNLVGGGALITQEEANRMVIDYHDWNDTWWGRWESTNSFLIDKELLHHLSENPLVSHYHVFYGRIAGARTLVFAGARNVGSETSPSFENVPYLNPAEGNSPYFMEHVFPIDREICQVLNSAGQPTGQTWPVKQYPDNQDHN